MVAISAAVWRHVMDLPELRGNRPCLDFANSLEPRRAAEPAELREYVPSYAGLVAWARHAGVLDAEQAAGLLAEAAARPAEAEAALARAIDLREATYRVFAAIADGQPPAAGGLDAVQRGHTAAMAAARIRPAPGGGLDWTWPDARNLDRPLWPLARSAVELLVGGQLERIKRCPDPCGWLFLDVTRNGSRRWCSMSECGNQAK